MVQEQQIRAIPPQDIQALQASARQDEQRALQEGIPGEDIEIQPSVQPHYPPWPTSKPGPRVTTPLPGMRPINAIRSEQVAEIGYNQETGEPAVASPLRSLPDESVTGPASFDQSQSVPRPPRRGKQRL